MYYGSGTGGHCRICAGQMLRMHSPDGSTLLREMTSRPPSWKHDVTSEILLHQSKHKEQSWQISSWSDLKRRSLGTVFQRLPKKKKKNSNKMRSVADPPVTWNEMKWKLQQLKLIRQPIEWIYGGINLLHQNSFLSVYGCRNNSCRITVNIDFEDKRLHCIQWTGRTLCVETRTQTGHWIIRSTMLRYHRHSQQFILGGRGTLEDRNSKLKAESGAGVLGEGAASPLPK